MSLHRCVHGMFRGSKVGDDKIHEETEDNDQGRGDELERASETNSTLQNQEKDLRVKLGPAADSKHIMEMCLKTFQTVSAASEALLLLHI